MAELKIRSFGELRDIIIEGLKEGKVISVDLKGREETGDDEGEGKDDGIRKP